MTAERVLYLRVSSREQGRSGLGFEGQLSALQRYADQQDYRVTETFREVCSGAIPPADRPELSKAMRKARESGCRVLVAKLDRLSRKVHHVSTLMEARVPFEIAALGPEVDPFELHLWASLAEKERALISERTKAALAAKRARGELLGNVDNLKDHGERGRQVQRERAVRELDGYSTVFAQYVGESYRSIARKLNAGMVKTPRGGTWHAKQVQRAMRRLELA